MPRAEDGEWFGTPDAARYLGVGQRTVYKLIDAGYFPAYRLGRVIRIRRSALDAYLERVQVRPGELRHLYPEGLGEQGPADL